MDWTVRELVNHLIGMNRVFAALLADEPAPPRPAADYVEDNPVGAYRDSAVALQAAFISLESSNAVITVGSGRPPAPNDCRSVSTTCSPTAGTSPRPQGNRPSCLMIWTSSRSPSSAPS